MAGGGKPIAAEARGRTLVYRSWARRGSRPCRLQRDSCVARKTIGLAERVARNARWRVGMRAGMVQIDVARHLWERTQSNLPVGKAGSAVTAWLAKAAR